MLPAFVSIPLLAVARANHVHHSASRAVAGFVGLGAKPAVVPSRSCITATENLLPAAAFSSRLGRQMAAMTSSAGEKDLPYRYQWPRPAVTVDCLIYALDEGEPWILLIKRKNDPFKGAWALPGGFVDENEGLDKAARRELEEETGVTNRTMVQTGAYGDPGRDPRGHTITVAFMAWAPSKAACHAKAGDDAAEAEFYPVKRLPHMAFDHLKVIADSWARCSFQEEAVAEGEGSSGGNVAVVDRASGQTLGVFAGTGLKIDTLAVLKPTEV